MVRIAKVKVVPNNNDKKSGCCKNCCSRCWMLLCAAQLFCMREIAVTSRNLWRVYGIAVDTVSTAYCDVYDMAAMCVKVQVVHGRSLAAKLLHPVHAAYDGMLKRFDLANLHDGATPESGRRVGDAAAEQLAELCPRPTLASQLYLRELVFPCSTMHNVVCCTMAPLAAILLARLAFFSAILILLRRMSSQAQPLLLPLKKLACCCFARCCCDRDATQDDAGQAEKMRSDNAILQ